MGDKNTSPSLPSLSAGNEHKTVNLDKFKDKVFMIKTNLKSYKVNNMDQPVTAW